MAWIGLVAVVSCCGCSLFESRDDTLGVYEATRRELVRNADGDIGPAAYEEEIAVEPLTINDFSPDNMTETVKKLTGNGPDPESAKQLYAQAEGKYRQTAAAHRQNPQADLAPAFIEAAQTYQASAERWPESTLEHDALFMAGEAYFFSDQYPKSEEVYELLLKNYPHSKHMDEIQPRRFAIATYWLSSDEKDPQAFIEVNLTDASRPRRDTFGHAIRVFDRIRLDDPTGRLADDATLAMGNAFFRRGKFLRSDEYYTDLRKTFPSSEHQFAAHFLGLKSKLLSYQGPDYSANALTEAEKLLKQLRRQFPAEAEREREFLVRANAELRYRQAEREWHLAHHYDKRSEFGAARFHYDELSTKFADTTFGERANQRIAAIAGRPQTPPQRLSWLVSLFPEKDATVPLLANDPTVPERR
jgi:outer membrane protein assembly factor BamD (BamD/ComL family)